MFLNLLFGFSEALFGIFTFFVLANRPLFAAPKQCKYTQKHLSAKLEIILKQILFFIAKFRAVCEAYIRKPYCKDRNFSTIPLFFLRCS